MSLILTKKKRYMVNEKIWPDVKDCLTELRKYDESVDPRVPVNSIIYYKNRDEIIFSNKEAIDAEKTAFSAYENYDVGLLLITNYYYLPKKRLTKEKVFRHSLYVIEKAPETKNIIFAILFYAKYKHQLSKIKHPIIKKMNEVLQGRTIPNYPTLAEIKDRADIYNIKI